jgi:hypothetical protein
MSNHGSNDSLYESAPSSSSEDELNENDEEENAESSSFDHFIEENADSSFNPFSQRPNFLTATSESSLIQESSEIVE